MIVYKVKVEEFKMTLKENTELKIKLNQASDSANSTELVHF